MSSASLHTVVVVGASLAGLRAVETLRRRGYDGQLVLVGAEKHLPYDRPPLSKEILQGKWRAEQTALRKPDTWQELELDLRLGRRATALDPRTREVVLEGDERVGYDGLVVATGAAPRRLRGTPDLDGIHVLRSLDDALAIADALDRSPRVCVVGAGFIGLEVAASCRARGLDVTALELLPVPLRGAIGERMGEHLVRIHRDRGVDLRCGIGVEGFGGGRRVERVQLSDGSSVETDLVVVGVGVAPETDWLASSGLRIDDGLVCDETCAAAPGIVAAGDVARWTNPLVGRSTRVEHWMNASEQGAAAAERLLAGDEAATPFAHVPFFWSDQYDEKIQFTGSAEPDDEVRVVHGTPEEGRFVALYGRNGRLAGALGFNRARQLIGYRRAIGAGISFEDALARAAA